MKAASAFWHMSHVPAVCCAGSLWVQAAAAPECQSSARGSWKRGWILHGARRASPDLCELLTPDLKLQRLNLNELLKLPIVITAFPAALCKLFFYKGTGDF